MPLNMKVLGLGALAVIAFGTIALCGIGGGVWYAYQRPAEAPTDCCLPNAQEIAASDILKVEFSRSSMLTYTGGNSAMLFGNVNPQSFIESKSIVSFASDGSAYKEESERKTRNGKTETRIGKFSAVPDVAAFGRLAEALVANDFLNAEGGPTSTALITNVLTITYSGGVRTIVTSNTGSDPPAVAAILRVFDDLDAQAVWRHTS